ncbi:MAG: guanylate kinase [Candidatus Sumerlaeia bacterium]|nr:guanylate kinase [Candidatus Sumerlaeia bacterium]
MVEFELKRSGSLFVISAPSGGGKSTILQALLSSDPSLSYSISATTRKRREGEVDGKDYFFLDEDDFRERAENGDFYEYSQVHGNWYGTLREEIDNKVDSGNDVLLDIDVQGSFKLKDKVSNCTSIFILPPSMATLEKRLRKRGKDDEETIQRRLTNAREEVCLADRYDFILVNRVLSETIENMRTVIRAQRFRSHRIVLKDALGMVLSSAGELR